MVVLSVAVQVVGSALLSGHLLTWDAVIVFRVLHQALLTKLLYLSCRVCPSVLHQTQHTRADAESGILSRTRTYRILLQFFCKADKAQKAGQAVHFGPQLVPQPGQGVGWDLPSADAPCQQEPELLLVHCMVDVCLHRHTSLQTPSLTHHRAPVRTARTTESGLQLNLQREA